MHRSLFLFSTLLLAQYPTLGGTTPIRTTFLVATETVIDNASAVDIRANDDAYGSQFRTLHESRERLSQMAEGQQEHDVADDVNNLVFLINACRIQARAGADTTKCTAQFTAAETRIMDAIHAHKTNGRWTTDAPAH